MHIIVEVMDHEFVFFYDILKNELRVEGARQKWGHSCPFYRLSDDYLDQAIEMAKDHLQKLINNATIKYGK